MKNKSVIQHDYTVELTKLNKLSRKTTSELMQLSWIKDWRLSYHEVKSEVDYTIIQLSQTYKPGKIAFSSYCFAFLKKIAKKSLLKEYTRLKNQVTYDELSSANDDEEEVKHQIIPRCDIDQKYMPLQKHIEIKDAFQTIKQHCDTIEKRTMLSFLMKQISEQTALNILDLPKQTFYFKLRNFKEEIANQLKG